LQITDNFVLGSDTDNRFLELNQHNARRGLLVG
jgi:hypothetical protein